MSGESHDLLWQVVLIVVSLAIMLGTVGCVTAIVMATVKEAKRFRKK